MVCVLRDQTEERAIRRALEISEEKYASLVANLPGIAYRCAFKDEAGQIEFVSKGCEALTGYAYDELKGGPAIMRSDLVFQEDRERVVQKSGTILETGSHYELEYRILTKDGMIRWVLERGAPRMDDDGHVEYLDGFIMDVTLQRQVRSRLELMQFAIDHSVDPVYWIRRDGSFSYFNDAAGRGAWIFKKRAGAPGHLGY